MFGTRLKEILKNKKMSFSDLRELLSEQKIKVTNSQLSYYANGKRKPKDKNIWLEIAKVLEVDLQEIILDIDYYLSIRNEVVENGVEKISQTENDSLFQELLSLIDRTSASELEKVCRYCSLASNFENLSKEIENEGVMISIASGENVTKKVNPAIAEKVKVNAALIKLDEFFEEKRSKQVKNNDFDEDDLYAD